MLVIDTDPGLDDAHALAIATELVNPEDLVITTVAGNLGIDTVTANACWLMSEFAPQVPVFRGAACPLVGKPVEAAHIHGNNGLGGYPRPDVQIDVADTPAAVKIIELAHQHPGELEIVALGPLTNLALALGLEPGLPDLVSRLTIMGGSPAQHGNASLNAEFNIFVDPAAAETVFARMHGISVITWDLCLRYRFTRAEFDGFWSGDSRQAGVLRAISEHQAANDPAYTERDYFGRADPLAMAVALRPEIVSGATSHRIQVVHDGGLAHGVTVVDERDATGDRSPSRIIDDFDRPALVETLTV